MIKTFSSLTSCVELLSSNLILDNALLLYNISRCATNICNNSSDYFFTFFKDE